MKTVCVQIGNSDDKLKQADWAGFVGFVDSALAKYEHARHFFGGSSIGVPWQNACWVIVIDEVRMVELFAKLAAIGTRYNQDSIAVLVGDTQFI